VSFADERERHRGLSHHSATILSDVCRVPVTVAVPELPADRAAELRAALEAVASDHEVVEADGSPAIDLLRSRGVVIESMGRTPEDDPAFFLAAGAAGIVAGRMSGAQRR
jgi:hypothetical protein